MPLPLPQEKEQKDKKKIILSIPEDTITIPGVDPENPPLSDEVFGRESLTLSLPPAQSSIAEADTSVLFQEPLEFGFSERTNRFSHAIFDMIGGNSLPESPNKFMGRVLSQWLGNLGDAGLGFIEFGGETAKVAGRAMLGMALFPTGIPRFASALADMAEQKNMTPDEMIEAEYNSIADTLGINREAFRAIAGEPVFRGMANILDISETHSRAVDLGVAAVTFPYHQLVEPVLRSSHPFKTVARKLLEEPFLSLPAAHITGKAAQAGSRLLPGPGRVGRTAADAVRGPEPTPIKNTRDMADASVAEGFDAQGLLVERPVAVPREIVGVATDALREISENPAARPVFEGAGRSLFDPDVLIPEAMTNPRVRVIADTAHQFIKDNGDGSALVRRPDGTYMDVPLSPVAAPFGRVVLPDPTHPYYMDVVRRKVRDSAEGRANFADRTLESVLKDPDALEAFSEGGRVQAGLPGPQAKAAMAEKLDTAMGKEFSLDKALLDALEEISPQRMQATLEIIELQNAGMKFGKVIGGARLPLKQLEGTGIMSEIRIREGMMQDYVGRMTASFVDAHRKIGTVPQRGLKSFLQDRRGKVSRPDTLAGKPVGPLVELQAEMRVLRESHNYLKTLVSKRNYAGVNQIPREGAIKLATAIRNSDGRLQGILDRLNESRGLKPGDMGFTTLETVVEGTTQLARLSDIAFMLEAVEGGVGLTWELFNRDYMPHLRRGSEGRPGITVGEALDRSALSPEQQWFMEIHRNTPVEKFLELELDPIRQDMTMIHLSGWKRYLEPMRRKVEGAERLMREGVTLDKITDMPSIGVQGVTAGLQPGVRIVFEPNRKAPHSRAGELVDFLEKRGLQTTDPLGREVQRGIPGIKDAGTSAPRQVEWRFEKVSIRPDGAHDLVVREIRNGLPVEDPISFRIPKDFALEDGLMHFRAKFPKEHARALRDYRDWAFTGESRSMSAMAKGIQAVSNAVVGRVNTFAGKYQATPGRAPFMGAAEAQQLGNMYSTLLYGGFLGFRPASVVKNLTQGPTLGGSFIGEKFYRRGVKALENPERIKELQRMGLWTSEFLPTETSVLPGDFGSMRFLTPLAELSTTSLKGFLWADRVNRITTVSGALEKIREQGKDFVPNLPSSEWNNAVKALLKEGNGDAAAIVYAVGTDVFSQWWYSKLNRPTYFRDANLLPVFGTWPINFAERIAGERVQRRKFAEASGGSLAERWGRENPQMVNAFNYAISVGALVTFGATALDSNIMDWFAFGALPSEFFSTGTVSDLQASLQGAARGTVSAIQGRRDPYAEQQIRRGWTRINDLMKLTPGQQFLESDLPTVLTEPKPVQTLFLGKGPTSIARKEESSGKSRGRTRKRGR